MKTLILLFSTCLLLAGCDFKAPLTDQPTRGIDKALLGSWFSTVDGSALDIYRLSKDEYLVIDDGKPYVCTHSDLGGTHFISCKEIENDKDRYGKYAYVAYQLKKGVLTTYTLNLDLPIKETMPPAQIRAVLERAVKEGKALDTIPVHVGRFRKKVS